MNTPLNFKQSITAGALAAVTSAAINALLFYIFKAADVITDTIFIQPNQPLTIVPIILSSVFPSLIGASIFFLFEKYTNKGFLFFSIIALVLMLLSFINPFVGIPGITLSYGVVLNVMHVVVAMVLLYFIKRAKQ